MPKAAHNAHEGACGTATDRQLAVLPFDNWECTGAVGGQLEGLVDNFEPPRLCVVTDCWRTDWRTSTKVPANANVRGGLENRFGP